MFNSEGKEILEIQLIHPFDFYEILEKSKGEVLDTTLVGFVNIPVKFDDGVFDCVMRVFRFGGKMYAKTTIAAVRTDKIV